MDRFTFRSCTRITAFFVASDPLPAVVGTAMNGRGGRTSLRSPTCSRYSRTLPSFGATPATAFAASIALPPPTATTTSAPASRHRCTPSSTVATSGSPETLQRGRPNRDFATERVSNDRPPVTRKIREPKRRATSSVFALSSWPNRISGGVRKVNDTVLEVRVRMERGEPVAAAGHRADRVDPGPPAGIVRRLLVGLEGLLVPVDLVEGE